MTTALITGASSGIGLEIARELAKEKMSLILVARQEKLLQELAKELREKHNIEVVVLPFDLAKPESPRKLHDEVIKRGLVVDVLVNNAGFGERGFFIDSQWPRQAEMLQLNIVALTELTHLFLPAMRTRRTGTIMNVASVASFQSGPGMGLYYATKAFVLSFSEAIAEELRPLGISVTALCPGPTESNFMNVAGAGRVAALKIWPMPTSKDVAVYGVHAMNRKQVVAIHGLANKLLVFTMSFMPRTIRRRIVMKLQATSN